VAINTGKVVVGGLASGVTLAVLDFVVNGLLMAEQNRAAVNALNPALAETMESTGALIGYVVLDLLFGILLVWTYAAMRPRFGAGPRTAVLTGVQVWLVAVLMYTGMTLMGMWTWSYMAMAAAAYLVIMVIAATVGGMLYKEGAASPAA
jgi:hypothetical protein